ncbi:MAG: hypothetical protein IT425_01395 [Pirellulales bacterium]|nr:hypothetical protein [Pirellulales bacterium]
MTWLAENSLPIWMAGALALTMAGIVYFQTRSRGSFYAVLGVIAVTAALLAVNRFVETPREAVERTLYELAAKVEANDVPGSLAYLAPNACKNVRADVETLMPQVRIERARIIGTPEIEMNSDGSTATIQCRGIILAVRRGDGMKGGGQDDMVLEWSRHGERWLLENYTSQKNWDHALARPQK